VEQLLFLSRFLAAAAAVEAIDSLTKLRNLTRQPKQQQQQQFYIIIHISTAGFNPANLVDGLV
jgi:hypothetical protein